MYRLVKLLQGTKMIGYRAFHTVNRDRIYDVSLESVRHNRIDLSYVTETLNVRLHNGMFVSEGELNSGVYAQDVSSSEIKVKSIFRNQAVPESPFKG